MLLGLLSKLRSLNVLSDTFDERQFLVQDDDFDPTNPTLGDRFEIFCKKKNMIEQNNDDERCFISLDPNVSDDEDDFSVDET